MRDADRPADWPLTPLRDVVESAVDGPFGSNLKTEHYVSEPGVRVVRLQNVGRGEFIEGEGAYVSDAHAATLHRHEVRGDDVIVASLGDERHPFGRACVYPQRLQPGIVKADCFRLRVNLTRAAPGFLMRALNVDVLRTELSGLAQGVTRDRVNLGNLLRFKIPLAPLPEQRRIADVLDTLDEAIRKTKELIAKLKQVKQGLLHDLLTRGIDDNGELRDPDRHPEQFKDSPLGRIPKAWEAALLGDVCRPRQWPTIDYSELTPDGYPVFGANGRIGFYSRFTHECSTVAVTCRGATCGAVHVTEPFSYITGNAMALDELDACRADVRFVAEYLASRGMGRAITGSAQPQIVGSAIRSVQLLLPPLVEQQAIVEILETHNRRGDTEAATVQKLRMIKQGLMEDLLTRRVRVTPLLTDQDRAEAP